MSSGSWRLPIQTRSHQRASWPGSEQHPIYRFEPSNQWSGSRTLNIQGLNPSQVPPITNPQNATHTIQTQPPLLLVYNHALINNGAVPAMSPSLQSSTLGYNNAVNTSRPGSSMPNALLRSQDSRTPQHGIEMAPVGSGLKPGVPPYGPTICLSGSYCPSDQPLYHNHVPTNTVFYGSPSAAQARMRSTFQRSSCPQRRSAPFGNNDQPSHDFVIEDPSQSRSRERNHRNEETLRNMEILKKNGGSCIWCYRLRKRCGATTPCDHCESRRHECIRESTELDLASAIIKSREGTNFGTEVFQCLWDQVIQQTSTDQIVVSFRHRETQAIKSLSIRMPQPSETVPDYKNEELISGVLEFTWSLELARLVHRSLPQHLVQSASVIFRISAAIQCLLKTQVHVHTENVDLGRMAIFYILMACMQSLQKNSRVFCSDLFDAVRQKYGMNEDVSWSNNPLNPTWVAGNLYRRVLEGLLHMELNPLEKVIGNIATFKNQVSGIKAKLLDMLDRIPVYRNDTSGRKMANNSNAGEYVPAAEGEYFDIALWVKHEDQELAAVPMALHGEADPFTMSSYKLEALLEATSAMDCSDGAVDIVESQGDEHDATMDFPMDPERLAMLDGNDPDNSFFQGPPWHYDL